MSHPVTRLRRLRENPVLRSMIEQTRLSKKDLVQPLFVKEGIARPIEIGSMPGVYRLSIADLVK
ncbi:MAG TPA: porphobilinogen synthase, partial [Pirellulaceae bacterium]|nr:porphobilinogen synthase [Pirellulaceae bacterium]